MCVCVCMYIYVCIYVLSTKLGFPIQIFQKILLPFYSEFPAKSFQSCLATVK